MRTLQQDKSHEFVHSVVLRKINACVSERMAACRLEKSGDLPAMIREKFCFHSSAGLGVVEVNAGKLIL